MQPATCYARDCFLVNPQRIIILFRSLIARKMLQLIVFGDFNPNMVAFMGGRFDFWLSKITLGWRKPGRNHPDWMIQSLHKHNICLDIICESDTFLWGKSILLI